MERVRVVDLNGLYLQRRSGAGSSETFAVAGSRRVVAAWANPEAGRVVLHARYLGGDGTDTFVLDAGDGPGRRASRSSSSARARLVVDEVRASEALASVTLEAAGPLGRTTLASTGRASGAVAAPSVARPGEPVSLAVLARSQYEDDGTAVADPALRASAAGWCAPTSLAMLLAWTGVVQPTPLVAAAVFDSADGGTGNWSYGAGYAARFAFAAVAYLHDLTHARRFVAAGFPLALSFAWRADELPGAALRESAGHLAVLRGFDRRGDPCFADPAQPSLLATYSYLAFERAWLAHGGVALVVGPESQAGRLLELANGSGPS